MSVFNGERLDKKVFWMDDFAEGLRRGQYADVYFLNTTQILEACAEEGYTFEGETDLNVARKKIQNGNIIVEMQFFTRRKPFSVVAGVDEALAILQTATGYYKHGRFVNTYDQLEVEAVQDGEIIEYDGNPLHVKPVLRIRGRYRDFAKLETAVLGALADPTRIATNVFNTLVAAGGKSILFFPARFRHYKDQARDGYAYSLGIQAYNKKFGANVKPSISTNAEGDWWGGTGGGTIAHASIAAFLGDTAETMLQFARVIDPKVPRIALVDFHNDCVATTKDVMKKMWAKYLAALRAGRKEEAERYRLFGVRPDTSGNMRDACLEQLGDKKLDNGVNPRLVNALRQAIDNAWVEFEPPHPYEDEARQWCRDVKIVVTGGFTVEKIKSFEDQKVPVDIYGVGSSLVENSSAEGTNNDYTADIVRVKLDDQWFPMAKVGRGAADNPNLKLISAPANTKPDTAA